MEPEPSITLLAHDRHAGAVVALLAAMRRFDGADPLTVVQTEQLSCAMSDYCFANDIEPAGVATLSYALALLAEAVGAVVTITQRPLEPLAMGNYVHDVSVRPRR
jgi:hypothetical protein